MQNKQPLSCFSRAVRRQLLTLDLVYALVSNLLESGSLKANARQCAKRIEVRVQNIKQLLYGGTRLVLTPKDLRQYSRGVNALLELVESMDVGGSQQRGLEFFNAVLFTVSDVRVQVLKSKNSKLRHEWLLIDKMLNTLYGYADLRLDNYAAMVAGELFGFKVLRLLGF